MKVPMFDAHCDTITAAMDAGAALRRNRLHVDLERLQAYSPCAQVFAVFLRPKDAPRPERPSFDMPDTPGPVLWSLCQKALSHLHRELEANADLVCLCTDPKQAEAAAEAGKIAAFIAVEGAELLDCSLDNLRTAFAQGVRLVNITWNFPNALSGTAMSSAQAGLTERGREFVLAAQDMGVAIDLSHASERAFWDVVDITKKPILAGHSNAKAICDVPRNLTDDQFRALVKLGGCAGLNLCPDFLGRGRDIEAVVIHAEHFLGLGGEKALCLGADLDGIDAPPKGVKGVEHMGEVYEAMLRRNWSEDLVRDIFYHNLWDALGRML